MSHGSHGLEVTNKTTGARAPPHAMGGHPNSSSRFTCTKWHPYGHLFVHKHIPAQQATMKPPCPAGGPASRRVEERARLLCQGKPIASSSLMLLGNLIANLRVKENDNS